MALTLTASANVQVSGTPITAQPAFTATLAGTNYILNVQSVQNSAEALLLGDVTPAYILVQNQDAAINVDIARDAADASPVATLKPGQWAFFPTAAAVTYYAKAASGSVNLLVIAIPA